MFAQIMSLTVQGVWCPPRHQLNQLKMIPALVRKCKARSSPSLELLLGTHFLHGTPSMDHLNQLSNQSVPTFDSLFPDRSQLDSTPRRPLRLRTAAPCGVPWPCHGGGPTCGRRRQPRGRGHERPGAPELPRGKGFSASGCPGEDEKPCGFFLGSVGGNYREFV